MTGGGGRARPTPAIDALLPPHPPHLPAGPAPALMRVDEWMRVTPVWEEMTLKVCARVRVIVRVC